MNNSRSIIFAALVGAIIGSAFGWISCSYFSASQLKANYPLSSIARAKEDVESQVTRPRTVLEVNELRIVGEDGKPCMALRGISPISADYKQAIFAVIEFYDVNGKLTHTMGTYGGSFEIHSKNPDGGDDWGIQEPETTFYSKAKKSIK